MSGGVALIDYGAGNLHSVANALAAAGATRVHVTDDPAVVAAADRVVLPGVGAFAHSIAALCARPGLIDAMNQAVCHDGRPFLGICVGMQLLAEWGEEHGQNRGLGWVQGRVVALAATPARKVPHMGWNDVAPTRPHPMVEPGEAYFLHGFALEESDSREVAALTDHDGPVVAAVARDNILGVQFHPEKSQRYGLDLLARFLAWRP